MDIEISENPHNPSLLEITLRGCLDESAATALSERLLLLCEGKIRDSIVINLKECEPKGSLGYGALVSFRLSPEVAGKKVSLLNVNAQIQESIRTLRLNVLFDCPEML